MTDSQKLDLILSEVQTVRQKVVGLEGRMDRLEVRLDRVEQRLDRVEQRLDKVEQRLDKMEDQLSKLNERVNQSEACILEIKDDLGSLKITVETETNRNILIIAEGHEILFRKFKEVSQSEAEKEMLMLRVNTLENDVRQIKKRVHIA